MKESGERVRGVVLWFSEEKGWGKIRDARGHLHHLDYSELTGDGLRLVRAGQAVEFESHQMGSTSLATAVVLVDRASG